MNLQPETQVWLCLRFDQLALNSLGFEHKSNTPVVITYQQQVWQCNSQASASGVKNEMSIGHALIVNSTLQLHERDSENEKEKLKQLSYWAYGYTSLVSQHGDHCLLLEIGKSEKLFKGLDHLISLIKADLANFRVDVSLGLAQTPKASIVLSLLNCYELDSSQAILMVKLECLELSNRTTQKLLHCGFQTLNDIKVIPRPELGSRFGQAFLIYLEQLQGHLADPQIAITPPETFHVSANFAEPINNVMWIQQQLDLLLDKLIDFISSRQLLCRRFTWRFYHENNRLIKTVAIDVNAQHNLGSMFKELTMLKLDNIKFDWEFSSITLNSVHLLPIQLFENDLFDPIPSQEQFQQLVSKLTTRLGHKSVYHIVTDNEHLPELSSVRLPANASQTERPSFNDKTQALDSIQRIKDQPLWLLEQPTRLAKQGHHPVLKGPLNIIHGPNRITSHWWETLQSRDYFIARQRNGRLLWIFFDRVERNWFLHGLYG